MFQCTLCRYTAVWSLWYSLKFQGSNMCWSSEFATIVVHIIRSITLEVALLCITGKIVFLSIQLNVTALL